MGQSILLGGTAGLALANRLTESGTQTVLVLEAGQAPAIVSSYRPPGANQEVLGKQISNNHCKTWPPDQT
jgi:choline dehydrogenase